MDKNRKEQHLIRFCCVLVSFALWIYIVCFVNPVSNIKLSNVPVEITNTDSLSQFKFTILPNQNFTVTLNLSGNASEISKATRDQFRLSADLSGLGVKKGVNKIPVKIVQKPDGVNITNGDTLWIYMKLDDLTEKTVPVKIETSGNVKDGYYNFPESLSPSEVVVTGAAQYVNRVTAVLGKVSLNNADSDTDVSIQVKAVDDALRSVNQVSVTPATVDLYIPVKKVKTVPVKVITKGALSNNLIFKSITAVPNSVEIAVDDKDSGSINELSTQPIDLSAIDINNPPQAKLIIPNGVKLINSSGLVNIKVTSDKIVQKNISMNIGINNLADGLIATLDNTKVSIVLSGDESVINNLKDGDVKCSVDLTNLGEGDYNLNVNAILPSGVQNVSMSPQTVKVNIKKKQ